MGFKRSDRHISSLQQYDLNKEMDHLISTFVEGLINQMQIHYVYINVFFSVSFSRIRCFETNQSLEKICFCAKWMVLLKAHQQVSKKRCFKKYCSCDKACQFSALQGTP